MSLWNINYLMDNPFFFDNDNILTLNSCRHYVQLFWYHKQTTIIKENVSTFHATTANKYFYLFIIDDNTADCQFIVLIMNIYQQPTKFVQNQLTI